MNKKQGRKMQKGIFTYLNNRGLTIHKMRFCLKEYGSTIGLEYDRSKADEFYDQVEAVIVGDFNKFKKFVKENFISSAPYQHPDSDDSWEEKNMNGEFAYNGASKDF